MNPQNELKTKWSNPRNEPRSNPDQTPFEHTPLVGRSSPCWPSGWTPTARCQCQMPVPVPDASARCQCQMPVEQARRGGRDVVRDVLRGDGEHDRRQLEVHLVAGNPAFDALGHRWQRLQPARLRGKGPGAASPGRRCGKAEDAEAPHAKSVRICTVEAPQGILWSRQPLYDFEQ